MNSAKSFGVLTGQEILDERLIINDFDPNSLKAASYDLRLGDKVFFCGTGSSKISNLKDNDETAIILGSFQSVIFSTLEIVRIPDGIVGRFDLMIGRGLDGLMLQVGPQVEPGYEGPLFGLILNTSGSNKSIKKGDRFLTIEFSRTSGPTGERYEEKKITDLEEFIKKDQGIFMDRLAEPNALDNLRNDLDSWKKQYDELLQKEGYISVVKGYRLSIKVLFWSMLGAIIAIIGLFLSLYLHQGFRSKMIDFFSFSTPAVSSEKKRIEDKKHYKVENKSKGPEYHSDQDTSGITLHETKK